jgi:hypothetical protein
MRIAITAFVAAFALLAYSAAADSTAPDTAATPSVSADPTLCIASPPPTGSHLPGAKECHTRSEWSQIHGAAGDAARQYLEHADKEQNALPTHH